MSTVTSARGPEGTAGEPGGRGSSPPLAACLAWLLPGLGHLYVGRPRRALLFGSIVLFMLAFGLALDGSLSRPRPGAYLSTLATLADLGTGPTCVVLHFLGLGAGRVTAATHEIGNTFHWSAGVMNMLLVLDAWDVAKGRK